MGTMLLTRNEAANPLRLSPAKVAALIATGDLPSIKIGRARRIPVDQLQQWVEKQLQYSREEAWQ